KAAVEDIDSQRTQSDILAALVRHAADFAPRVVFFVIKSGDAVGWKASGFENGLNDETVKLLTIPAQRPRLLRDALTSLRLAASNPELGDDDSSEALGIYGRPAPERAVAIPLIVLNKAVAVLYADSGAQSESSLNAEAAESLTRITGRTIELMLSRRGAEHARPGAQTAGETPPATSLRTDGKAMGASIQQTPSQLTVQPTAQMDSARVEPELKQGYAPEIHNEFREIREIREDAPQIAKTDWSAGPAPNEIIAETRLTREIPLVSFKDSQVDESLRQAEAQLPEPAYIETEPRGTSGPL